MSQKVTPILCAVLFLTAATIPAVSQTRLAARATDFQPSPGANTNSSDDSDRAHDGLLGPVRRVRTEVVKVSAPDGKVIEDGKRVLLETSEYNVNGKKTHNQYFPVASSAVY